MVDPFGDISKERRIPRASDLEQPHKLGGGHKLTATSNAGESGHGPPVDGDLEVFAGLSAAQDSGDVVAKLALRNRGQALTVADLLRIESYSPPS